MGSGLVLSGLALAWFQANHFHCTKNLLDPPNFMTLKIQEDLHHHGQLETRDHLVSRRQVSNHNLGSESRVSKGVLSSIVKSMVLLQKSRGLHYISPMEAFHKI